MGEIQMLRQLKREDAGGLVVSHTLWQCSARTSHVSACSCSGSSSDGGSSSVGASAGGSMASVRAAVSENMTGTCSCQLSVQQSLLMCNLAGPHIRNKAALTVAAVNYTVFW
jgi:hypothetical protein